MLISQNLNTTPEEKYHQSWSRSNGSNVKVIKKKRKELKDNYKYNNNNHNNNNNNNNNGM